LVFITKLVFAGYIRQFIIGSASICIFSNLVSNTEKAVINYMVLKTLRICE